MANPIIKEDDEYVSSEDSDFAPDTAPAQDSDQSDSEPEDGDNRPAKRRRTTDVEQNADDAGYENSGDEAIIKKGEARKQRRRDRRGEDAEDEGGEGGLIKTRRQRAQEYGLFRNACVSFR